MQRNRQASDSDAYLKPNLHLDHKVKRKEERKRKKEKVSTVNAW